MNRVTIRVVKNGDTKVSGQIYQFNNYSKVKTVSATQAGRLLFYKTNQPLNDIKAFDTFKRKIYTVFERLVTAHFLINENRNYHINESFERNPSLFDKK